MRTGTENQINWYLFRHGATKANKEGRYLGKTEEGLSEEGAEQLKQSVKKLWYPQTKLLFGSPMKRCRETAEILYPEQKMFLIPEWREMDFGDFEGKNYKELCRDKNYQAFIDSNGTLPFPNGEDKAAFAQRCCQGFLRMQEELLLQERSGKDIKTIVSIVHGGTIMALLSSLYQGAYFEYQIANGGGYHCVLEKREAEYKVSCAKRMEE